MANEVAKLIFKADTSDIEAAIKRLGYLKKSANDAEQQVGQLGNEAKKAAPKIKGAGDEAQKGGKKFKGFGDAIAKNKGKVLGFAAAITAMALVINRGLKVVEEAGSEFSIFRARLITATGSVEAATQAFKDLNAFALETPFTLAESVNGFAKLTNLGLNPSRAAMVSFANTSAAMGGSLEQMIEAVADATTFEFERLKEFGIKSSQEGDKVTFTFRGVSTEINKSATEVSKYLENIGNTVFAGAAIEQTKTLKGSISNLEQAFGNLAIAAGELSGANDVFAKSNNDLAATVSDPDFQKGMANLSAHFARIKASIVGLSADAFAGFIKAITATDIEAISDTARRIEQANTRISSMITLGISENSQTFKQARNDLADLQAKMRELKDESVGTVADVMGVGAMIGSDAPFSMMDGVANTGETAIPMAPEGMSSADVARQEEIDRTKSIEAEFEAWKLGRQQTELEVLQEQFLLKEEAQQLHFDNLIQQEIDKAEKIAEIELEKKEERNDIKKTLDKTSFLDEVNNGKATEKFLKKAAKSDLDLTKLTGKQKLKLGVGIAGDILAHAAQNSETAFKLQKGLKIAEAIQNTYSAAMGAYSSLAPIPFVGPALGIAAAGVAVQAGAANVKAIAATKFDKSGAGGSVGKPSMPSAGGGGGGVAAASAADIAPLQVASEDGEEVGAASVVNVTVDGSIDPSGARRIIEAINEATEDGLQINALVGT